MEFEDKWGLSFFQTFGPVSSTPGGLSGATITWSYTTDGQGFSNAQTTLPFFAGSTSSIGSIRTALNAKYGAGAFEAAVHKAFAAWASVANVLFTASVDIGAGVWRHYRASLIALRPVKRGRFGGVIKNS